MSFLDSSRSTPSWKESCYHKTNFKEVEFCLFQIFSRLKELALWFFGRNTFVNKGHLCVMWQPGWEWSLGKNGYMYMYIWVHLLVTWNYHNIVYWLYPNNKQKGYFLSNSLWDSSKSNFPERLFLLAFCAYPIEVTLWFRFREIYIAEIIYCRCDIHWKDWYWSWSSNNLATWCKEPSHWKRPWCWEQLRSGGEGGDRGWDGWVASSTQWTWDWANSRRWWRTGKPDVLQSLGLQRVRHDWV